MFFEWDDAKAASNFLKHGIRFVDAVLAWEDPRGVIHPDLRRDYGERRLRLLGLVRGRVLAIIYTERVEATRIISARKANIHEQKIYDAHHAR